MVQPALAGRLYHGIGKVERGGRVGAAHALALAAARWCPSSAGCRQRRRPVPRRLRRRARCPRVSSRGAVERGRDSGVDRVWRARGAPGGRPRGGRARSVGSLFRAGGPHGGRVQGRAGRAFGGPREKIKKCVFGFLAENEWPNFRPFLSSKIRQDLYGYTVCTVPGIPGMYRYSILVVYRVPVRYTLL